MLDKIKNLINACKDDPDMLEFLGDQFDTFGDYVNAVARMEYKIPILRATKDDVADFQNAVQELDKMRRVYHNSAINACNILNRFSAKLGLEPFYEGSTDDRYQVADFAGRFVNELYCNGIYKEERELHDALMNGEASIDKHISLENLVER